MVAGMNRPFSGFRPMSLRKIVARCTFADMKKGGYRYPPSPLPCAPHRERRSPLAISRKLGGRGEIDAELVGEPVRVFFDLLPVLGDLVRGQLVEDHDDERTVVFGPGKASVWFIGCLDHAPIDLARKPCRMCEAFRCVEEEPLVPVSDRSARDPAEKAQGANVTGIASVSGAVGVETDCFDDGEEAGRIHGDIVWLIEVDVLGISS